MNLGDVNNELLNTDPLESNEVQCLSRHSVQTNTACTLNQEPRLNVAQSSFKPSSK